MALDYDQILGPEPSPTQKKMQSVLEGRDPNGQDKEALAYLREWVAARHGTVLLGGPKFKMMGPLVLFLNAKSCVPGKIVASTPMPYLLMTLSPGNWASTPESITSSAVIALSCPARNSTRLVPASCAPASLNVTSAYRASNSARRVGFRENEREQTATLPLSGFWLSITCSSPRECPSPSATYLRTRSRRR